MSQPWQQRDDVDQVDSGDQVVVTDLAADEPRPQVLAGVAATIWRLLEEPRTEEELVSELLDTYPDAEADQVRVDVDGFLEQLAAAGLAVRGLEGHA